MSVTDFLIIAVVTTVLNALISRGANATRTRRATLTTGPHGAVLTYPRGFRILAVGMLVGCAAIGILIAFVVDAESELDRVLGILLIVLPLTGVSAWLLWEAIGRRLTITDAGLETRSPWGTTHAVAWRDVEEVHYSHLNSWLVLRGRGGVRVRASRYLNGTQDLCEAMAQHLGPKVLARAARDLEAFRHLSVSAGGAA
jgi:hypothetical protein